ncbi:MAG: hypothetical protein VX644_15430, partial [Planctomycetota bacterium]|nr:hypothetical protein [Planctomycetota bacterium]
MLQRKRTLWTACLLSLFFFSTSAQAIEIDKVIITADKAYHFGWGTRTNIPNNANQWFPGNIKSGGSIFNNPDEYPPNPPLTVTIDDYFYIICVSDSQTTQGVIAEVFAKVPDTNIFSGAGLW